MSEKPETSQSNEENTARLEGYEEHGGGRVAVFKDSETGKRFFLDKEEIEDKIENLKREGMSCEEEEKALKEWPRSIDKIII